MSKLTKLIALLIIPLLAACSNNNDNNSAGPADAELRITHASADAPAVNVYVDGERLFEEINFAQTSGLVFLPGNSTLEVEVRGILPDQSEVTVIGPVDLTFAAGERTDVLAINNLFSSSGALTIEPKVLEPVAIEAGITDVRVTVLHAAPEVGTVDIYVTAPDDDLANNTPVAALSFGEAAGPVAIAADTQYQVRITPTGSLDVVYDSGELSFPAGTELVAAAVENTFKLAPSPVTLLAIGPETSSQIPDVATGAAVRVVHNSADTPAVDILVNGTAVIEDLTFPNATQYDQLEAPAGTYTVAVAAAADPSVQPIVEEVTLTRTDSYTVIAAGSLANDALEAIITNDVRRNIATAAIVRVVHGAYAAVDIPVDIYLTSDGVIADAEPVITGLAYGEATAQLQATPNNYWVTVTAAGDKSFIAFDSGGTLALDGDVNYTVIARDLSEGTLSIYPIDLSILTN
ncbi:MAG: DUF4397 domain-containing protein [Halioglobus sp.]|nr:DUF4397 domain-containing protein [Halioglobus sp.]